MGRFVSHTSEKEKQKIDRSVSLAFYANNIAFNAANSTAFKTMCNDMRPSYNPPDRRALSGRLLDLAYEEVEDRMTELLSPKEVLVISQDGWTNTSQDPIIAHSLHDSRKSYLLDIEDCGSAEKTAEYCFEKARDQILKVQDKHGKTVFGCVTDNEAKMVKMKELLEEAFPGILTWGCASHHANLIIQKIITEAVRGHIIHVNKYFKHHHKLHGLLMAMGGVQPKLPMEVRWNSNQECYESFVSNHDKYRTIRANNYDTDLIDSVTAAKIDNIGLLMEAKHELLILTKFSVALDRMQSDTCR